eukprot:3037-Heterococcus_DN1.PRE.5
MRALNAHNSSETIACTCCITRTLQEVQRDNLALYKKLRFMTAYSKGQQQQQQPHSRQPRNNTGSSSSGAGAGMLSDRDAAATAAAEARYADLYERELDPFRAFAQSEAEVSVTTSATDPTNTTYTLIWSALPHVHGIKLGLSYTWEFWRRLLYNKACCAAASTCSCCTAC